MTEKLITPEEYISENYADNGEFVVWWGNSIVQNIVMKTDGTYQKMFCASLLVNSVPWQRLPGDAKVLRVEEVCGADWRGQLHALVDGIPEELTLEALVMMRERY